jgi:hypothetical protein
MNRLILEINKVIKPLGKELIPRYESLALANITGINDNELKKALSKLNTDIIIIKDKLTKILTVLYKLKILHFNCKVRNVEGKFINQSLDLLKTDMTNIIKKTLSNETLFYDKNTFPYCRDILTDVNTFDVFYKLKQNGVVNGHIISTIQSELKDEFENLKFVILSVINLSANDYTNNPPNPPYINLYELIYYTMIYNKDDKHAKIKDSLTKVLNKVKTYNFYKTNQTINSINIDSASIQNIAETVITLIKRNNASTLIGGLEIADSIQSLTYNMLPCSDVPEFKHKLDKFTNPSFKLNHMDYTTLNYQKKYNKYKHKYIQLKNKLKSQ